MRFSSFALAITAAITLPSSAFAQTLPSVPPGGSVIDLTQSKSPTVLAADAVDTVREGTHFVGRTGRLTRTTDGQQMIITFDNDGTEAINPRMIVQPNLNLLSIESVLAVHNPVTFRVSGTVTEYKGLNYILLDNAQTVLASATVPAPAKSGAAHGASAKAEAAPPSGGAPSHVTVAVPVASAQQTMNRLLAPPPSIGEELPVTPGVSSARDTSTGKTAIAPDAPVLKIIREGTHLIDKVGRLNHTPDGKQAILTFDVDGKPMQDPPMIILPSMKLSAMEGAVAGLARDAHFRVSGTVTEYKGRNYILLNKAAVIADVEVQF